MPEDLEPDEIQTWEIWYPGAAATGLLHARARVAPSRSVWVHSVPRRAAVTVRGPDDSVMARGEPLERDGAYVPMTRLWIEDGTVGREDRWPTEADLGAVVILPGGEAGILTAWWNAEDGAAWRWSVEFSNRR